MTDALMIEVRNLFKTFDDPDGGTVAAVAGAKFSCRAGEIYGLLGPNGAGKTTTLRCLATILTPTEGDATIAGYDLVRQPQAVRRSIGFLSASTGLYARLTARETMRFFGSMYGMSGPALNRRVEEVLEMFEITKFANRPADRLSTGMRQRVGLARAVVHDPPVVILDEPTGGLDPIVSMSVERAVQKMAAAGKCVLFSTHLLDQAETICHRLGVIGNGKVLAEGTTSELKALTGTQNLRGAFLKLIEGAEAPVGGGSGVAV
jgi:sodium transport system ATP-binding protein